MVELGWNARPRPLPAEAAIAGGALASALARRLLGDPQSTRFRAAAASGCLLIAGKDLPWLDGIVYLGIDRAAPSLWLPTGLQPDFPLDLLEAAIRRLGQPLPCVVLPDVQHPSSLRSENVPVWNQAGEGKEAQPSSRRRPGSSPHPHPDPDWGLGPGLARRDARGDDRGDVPLSAISVDRKILQGSPFLFSAHDLRPLDLEMLAAWLAEQP